MGAVSPTVFPRLFIGNAAERALDRLNCDVLIVKPRGFRSSVQRRPQTAAPRPAMPDPIVALNPQHRRGY